MITRNINIALTIFLLFFSQVLIAQVEKGNKYYELAN